MAQRSKQQRRRSAPAAPARPLRTWQQVGVITGIIGVILVCWPEINDIYVLPKAVVLWLSAIFLLALVAWRAVDEGELRIPAGPVAISGAAVVVVMVVTSLLGDRRMLSFVGEYARDAGVLTYGAAFVVLLAGIEAFDRATVRVLATALAVTAVLVAILGCIQQTGAEPFGLTSEAQGIVGTLGQPNFIAGFLGVAFPLVAWIAVRRELPVGWRAAGGVGAVLVVVAMVSADSFQGYVGMLASGAVFAALVASTLVNRRQLVLGLVATLVVVGAGAAVLHSTIDAQVRNGMNERVLLWQASGNMVKDSPVIGHGMSGFAAEFGAERPKEHARKFGPLQLADAPHSVPISMAVGGGVLLFAAYLAFVVVGALMAWRAVVRTTGAEHLLAAALAAGWIGFQLQSLISIDMPTLILLQVALVIGLTVLAGPVPIVRRTLGWAQWRTRNTPTSVQVVRGVAVVLALVFAWQAIRPMRADSAYLAGLELRASGRPEEAVPKFLSATSMSSWDSQYWAGLAAAYAASGDQDNALVAGVRAAEIGASRTTYWLSAAQLAGRMGRDADAVHYFERAREEAPYLAQPLAAYGDYLAQQDHPAQAIRWFERAVALEPTNLLYLQTLAENHEAAGQDAAADRVWNRILDIQPTNLIAARALGEVDERGSIIPRT